MIALQGICKTFGKDEAAVHALSDINVNIRDGEMVAIMGKSGCGKSTLLNILGGLMQADAGSYLYNETALQDKKPAELTAFRRDKVGIVVQYFALIGDMNVYENVALPLRYQKRPRREIRKRVHEVLNKLGLSDKAKYYPDELSGGQQQRVAIARAVVKNPDVLLADEPTGALDEKTGADMMEIFHQLHRDGKTVIIVTHDSKIAQECQRTIHMRDGKIDPEPLRNARA